MNKQTDLQRQRAIDLARETLAIEGEAILTLQKNLTNQNAEQFAHAIEILLACTGRVVVSGIGKSGHIGRKSIPVAGGMAGGSADAAATIVGIDYLYSLGMTREDMVEIAAQLGSDVPFMLSGGTAIGRGHGDQLTAALSRGTYHWVLALSTVGLSTPAVYAECDRLRAELEIVEPQTNEALMQALLAADAAAVGGALVNDLQAAACSLRPALRLVLDVGQEYGALGAIVSGSGPTVAFLVADEEAGLDLAVALTSSGVVGSVARAYGPVAGAKVIS